MHSLKFYVFSALRAELILTREDLPVKNAASSPVAPFLEVGGDFNDRPNQRVQKHRVRQYWCMPFSQNSR